MPPNDKNVSQYGTPKGTPRASLVSPSQDDIALKSKNASIIRPSKAAESADSDDRWPLVSGGELAAILQDAALPAFPEDEELPQHRTDISTMHADLLGEIEARQYSKTSVDDALHTLLTEIRKLNTVNAQVNERLRLKEQRLKRIVDLYNADPRVGKVLEVATFWRAECEKNEQTTKDLWQQLEHLQMDLESSMYAIQNNKNVIGRLSKENRACHDDRLVWDSMQSKFSQQATQLQECVEARKQFKEQVTVLQDKLATSTDVIRDLMKIARTAADYENKMRSLEVTHQKLRTRYDDLVFKSNQYEKRSETRLAHLDIIENNMSALQSKNRSMEKKVNALKSQLTKSQNTLGVKKEQSDFLHKEINRQLVDLKSLQSQLYSKHCELQTAKTTIASYKSTIINLKNKLHECNKDVEDCGLENRNITVELDLHKNETSRLQTANSSLMHTIEHKDRYLQNKDEYIRFVNTEIGNARHKAIMLLNNIEDMVAESIRLQQKNTVLYQFGIDMKERATQYNDKNEVQKRMIVDKDSKIMDMLVQVAKLEQSYNRLSDTLMKTQSRNHAMASEARRQLEEMRSLHRALHFSAAEVKTFCDKFDNAQKEVKKLQLADVRNNTRINNLESESNAQKEKIVLMLANIREERNQLEYFMKEVNHMAELLKYESIRASGFQQQRDIMSARVLAGTAREQLLQQKVKVMEQVIHHGKRACDVSNNDITILKKELLNQRRELKNLRTVLEDNKHLKDELIKCKKELILEENKRSVLNNLINPRLHPNRLLKAIFPSKYEMLLKNQKLVRCFIKKVDENINRQQEVIGLKKDLMSMKLLLQARGTDTPADVAVSRAELRKRERTIKSLTAELNCAKDDLHQARAATDLVTREFMTFKAKVNDGVYLPRSLSRPRPVSTLPPIEPNKDGISKRQKGGGFVVSDISNHNNTDVRVFDKSNAANTERQQQVSDVRKNKNNNTSPVETGSGDRSTSIGIKICPLFEKTKEVPKYRTSLPNIKSKVAFRNIYKKSTSLSSAERMMKTAANNKKQVRKIAVHNHENCSHIEIDVKQTFRNEVREDIPLDDRDENNGNVNTSRPESNG